MRTTPATSPSILDVGGRTSPYTIGLKARVTVLDVPREGRVRTNLNLGMTDGIADRLRRRRSNIEQLVIDDMTRTTIPDHSFDGIAAVETIEHVVDDQAFVRQAERLLKPGGWFYLTTPNGDYVLNEPPNRNPDHVRHYTRDELISLLKERFPEVEVVYGVRTGRARYRGLRSISPRRPLQALSTGFSNLINRYESRDVETEPRRTAHLFACARKQS
ncbi:MAG: methyltransferase domain-containing protein [bacterium]|nr:methyltransferase domain-containing protein [bacterium]